MKKFKISAIVFCFIAFALIFNSCAKKNAGISEDYVKDSDISAESGYGNSVAEKPISSYDEDDDTSSLTSEYESKIIKNSTVSSETKNFDKAVAEIEALVKSLGGYIEKSDVTGRAYDDSKYSRSANYSIRIPAEKFGEFMDASGKLTNVVSSQTTSEDVSLKYYDIQAILYVLETKKAHYEDMIAEAKTLSEKSALLDAYYNVVSEIESYKSALNLYDSQVTYSTITFSLHEVVEYTPDVNGQSWGERISAAFKESWTAFAEGFKDFSVFIVSALPTLLVLAFIGFAVLIVIKVIMSSAKKKESERIKKRQQETERFYNPPKNQNGNGQNDQFN